MRKSEMARDYTEVFSELLRDVTTFVEAGGGLTIRHYQREALRRIIDSVEKGKGHTIVVVFPRQSGKNEMQAQIEAYLLARYSDRTVEMVKVSPTWKPQSQNAMRRLERALGRNPITRKLWKKEGGYMYTVGKARITFLSGSPTSKVVGATASLLLSCDEAQDIDQAKWDRDFNPMAASTNATKVFWGTAWTAETLLAREKREALKAEARDGEQRVFEINADTVRAEVPEYGVYVDKEVARMGRWHPMVRTQYFSEEMEAAGGMFPPEREALMRGKHKALEEPERGRVYAFLIDVGGESDYKEDQKLGRRACSALTIVEIDPTTVYDDDLQAPRYLVRKRELWQGTRHTELHIEIKALAEIWDPRYIIIYATGVGAGLASFLGKTFPSKVVPFTFSAASKSKLGWDFLTVVETGRFKDFILQENYTEEESENRDREWQTGNERKQGTLQELFWRQVRACEMDVRVGPGQVMRWGVQVGKRVAGALQGGSGQVFEVLHDDLLVSAALCGVLDRQVWGRGESVVIPAEDPLEGLGEVF